MRLLVAAPPKTGNVWFEHLVSVAYGLQWIRQAPPVDYWKSEGAGGLREVLASGVFPVDAVCHQHFGPSAELLAIAAEWDIALATTLRHPYDQFVSWYWYIQRFPDAFRAANDPGAAAIDKPLDDPIVLDLLATRFGRFIDQGVAWLESGRSLIVRYDALHESPADVVEQAGRLIGRVPVVPVEEAIARSNADAMRRQSPDLQLHVRSARTGDWRDHLTEPHLEVFRTVHRTRIERLGYVVE